jgi:hypothetical protein
LAAAGELRRFRGFHERDGRLDPFSESLNDGGTTDRIARAALRVPSERPIGTVEAKMPRRDEHEQPRKALRRIVSGLVVATSAGIATEMWDLNAEACVINADLNAFDCARLPRTGGAVVEAWAHGAVIEAVSRTGPAVPDGWAHGAIIEEAPSGGSTTCDLSHACELIARSSGIGTTSGITIKRQFAPSSFKFPANLPFEFRELIDYPNGDASGCYPTTGSIRVALRASDQLVLDFQGRACGIGGTSQLLFTGTYLGSTQSTGMFANAPALGTLNIQNASGLPDSVKLIWISLSGQFLLNNEAP